MLKAFLHDLVATPLRLRQAWSFVNDPNYGQTFYPEAPRKRKYRIMLDHAYWVLRFGEVNRQYFVKGLDRKQDAKFSDVLPRRTFIKLRRQADATMTPLAAGGRPLNYSCIIDDKLLFGFYVQSLGFRTPEIVALVRNGIVVWLRTGQRTGMQELLRHDLDVMLKVIRSDQGVGVFRMSICDGRIVVNGEDWTLDQLGARITDPYILQQRVVQHPDMAALHAASTNTVRLVTAMVDGHPVPIGAIARFGARGAGIDNWAKGGVAAVVDLVTGQLTGTALMKPPYGTKVLRHPDSQIPFEAYQVPHFSDAVQLACDAHEYFYGFHSIGWDIAISREGPSLLEANAGWDVRLQSIDDGLKDRFLASLPWAYRSGAAR